MLYIEGNTVRLTRGDTAYLTVPIYNIDGTEYVMAAGDTLVMSMKHALDDETPCMQKTVTGTNAIQLEPSDTSDCVFGRYVYDVQLTLANGDVFTVVEPSCFEVLSEVNC